MIVATNNMGKLKEIKEIFGEAFDLHSLKDVDIKIDIKEDGNTFYDNALIKAKTIGDLTGEVALADDSGLVVEALDGAPGVLSARYAGEDATDEENIDKLLSALSDKTSEEERQASFESCVVAYFPDGRIYTAGGKCMGYITKERLGTQGFGYDPVFYSYDLRKTFGEASSAEKNTISHRGRALEMLERKLNNK